MRTWIATLAFVPTLMTPAAVISAELTSAEMTVEFDSSELDLRNDRHHLHGHVRIEQGPMSISADDATASALQTDNSRWTFERAVHLQTLDADLKSDEATADFAKGALAHATVTGSPAVFEQRRALSGKLAKGRAGQIDYDIPKGIVTLSHDVWFNYDGNEFHGDVIVYEVHDERVTVNPEGQTKGRVKITIRPRSGAAAQPPQDSSTPPADHRGDGA